MRRAQRWFRSAGSGRFSKKAEADAKPAEYVAEYAKARDPELVAQAWHETLGRLAPGFSYAAAPAIPWGEVPYDNRRLMIAVAQELMDRGVI